MKKTIRFFIDMIQAFSLFRFIWIRLGCWLLPIPFICLCIYLNRYCYIDGGVMATALCIVLWTLAYMIFLSGESIYRRISKKEKPWLGLVIIGIIISLCILFVGGLNLIWYLQ